MKRISLILPALALPIALSLSSAASAQETYRWRDADGKVHYTRTLPPEAANLPYEVLNSAGIVIKRVEDPLEEQKPKETKEEPEELEPLFTPEEVLLRSDNLLMLRYHSEQELVDAMENEVAQLSYDNHLITQSRSSAMSTLRAQVKTAADRQRSGMPEDKELTANIERLRNRLRKSEQSLEELREREAKIRATFQKNIDRYRFLRDGGRPGTPQTG